MSSPSPTRPGASTGLVYRFGQFELRADSGELCRKSLVTKLPEQPLQILLALLEHPGDVVNREALRSRLWSEDTFVDFEVGLNAAIKRLRRALLDDAENPRFIETLPKRGYRFLAPVSASGPGVTPEPSSAEPSGLPAVNSLSATQKRHVHLRWLERIVLVGLVLLVVLWFVPRSVRRPVARAARHYSILLPENAPLAPASMMPLGVGRPNVAISRDGERIVYVGVSGESTQLFLRNNADAQPHVIPGTGSAHSPFFSPDGQWVGFFAESKLKKIRLDGGPPITLCDVVLGFGGYWTADNDIYFSPGENSSLYKISASGGIPTQLVPSPEKAGFLAFSWPQALNGGEALLFGNSRFGVGVFRTSPASAQRLTRNGSSPRWSETGHILYVEDGVLWAAPFDSGSLKMTAPPTVLFDNVRMELQGAAQYDISAEGTLVYASGPDAAMASFVWVTPSGEVKENGLEARRYGEFRLSPDGKALVVVIRDGTRTDLWSFDIERKVLTRLTDLGAVWAPLWRPDGKKIVFGSFTHGHAELTEIDPDGSHIRMVATVAPLTTLRQFTPDGLKVIASGLDTNGNMVCLVDVATGEKSYLQRSSDMRAFPTISPDGKWLAYVSDETGRWEIYIRPFNNPDQKWRITTAGGEEPLWDKAGKRIFFRNGDQWMRVDISLQGKFHASEPVQVLRGPYVNIPGYSYDIAPDGRFLLLKSEYQDKKSYTLEVIENWPALLKDKGK